MSTIRAETGGQGEVLVSFGDQQVTLDSHRGPAPIELLAASLAACMVSSGRRFLRRAGIESPLEVECDFSMSETRTDHIARIRFTVTLPTDIPTGRREALDRILKHCAAHNPTHLTEVEVVVLEARAAV